MFWCTAAKTEYKMARKKQRVAAFASAGGKARALSLTPEAKKQIARAAAAARWAGEGRAPVQNATHEGIVKIGSLEIPCAVLDDKTRVLTETGMINALGLYRSGAVHVRGGGALPLFVSNKNIIPFVDEELADKLLNPRWFFPVGGGARNKGIEASLVPQICEVWLRARDAGVLSGNSRQEIVAVQADILMRGLAKVGIIALVDEATGHQDDRARDDLATILAAFVAEELQRWVKTFPAAFYKEMCRLRGVPFPPPKKNFPQYFGHLTNDVVYDRLAPGLKRELQNKNPTTDSGHRDHRHHQHLTRDIGHPRLLQHLGLATGLMRVSDTWDDFMKLLDRAAPKYPPYPTLFDHDFDED